MIKGPYEYSNCEGKVFRLSARRFTGIQLANCWMMEINNNSFCWSVAGAVPSNVRMYYICTSDQTVLFQSAWLCTSFGVRMQTAD